MLGLALALGSPSPTPSPSASSALSPDTPHGVAGWALSFFEAFGWPHAILILLAIALLTPRIRRQFFRVLRRVTSFKVGGVEVELKREESQDFQIMTTRDLLAYRKRITEVFEAASYQHQLRDRLGLVYKSLKEGVLKDRTVDIKTMRCTVHVRDVLFDDTLYQLLPYYPGGDGAGRTFPTRFGILGKAWRLSISQFAKDVPKEANKLIEQWGMSREQAEHAGIGRQSFAAICLFDLQGVELGVFYMDAAPKDAFKLDLNPANVDEKLEKAVRDACLTSGLITEVAAVNNELRVRAPNIPIHAMDP
jgi:hypothetical protein